MLVSRTPFRISFVGGGTDLRDYYKRNYGAVVSTTIQKYMYVAVNPKFDGTVRISYSETENTYHVDDIKHNIIREALKFVGIEKGIEVVTIADIPGKGTGLGSSSSLDVGLLNALNLYNKQPFRSAPFHLAKDACKIEIDILKQPIGKQDQFAAALGGLNYIRFDSDEKVFVSPIVMSKSSKRELEINLLGFFTGITRSSSSILTTQRKNIPDRLKILDKMRDQASVVNSALRQNDLTRFGETLHQAWLLKKQLAKTITNPLIDHYYNSARKAGALGGKISGAGGGGFFTLYCEQKHQPALRKALKGFKEMDVSFSPNGSTIIYKGGD